MASDATVITVRDLLQSAFQALLRNDLAERDRLCGVLERAWPAGAQEIPNDTPIPYEAWNDPAKEVSPGSGRDGTG
jgi:hypothetical protein